MKVTKSGPSALLFSKIGSVCALGKLHELRWIDLTLLTAPIFLLLLSACDSGGDDTSSPSFAAANKELISCAATESIDPTSTIYEWKQIGETIHGAPPPVTPAAYDTGPVIGLDVEISSDGSQVISSIGYDIARSYSNDGNGLVQTDTDIETDYLGDSRRGRFDLSGDRYDLSADGKALLVRSDIQETVNGLYTSTGSVKLYVRSPTSGWLEVENIFRSPHNVSFAAINTSGTLIAVSYYRDNDDRFFLKTYRLLNDGSWVELEPLVQGRGEAISNIYLSNDGQTMVGRIGDGVSIYKLIDNAWVYQTISDSEIYFYGNSNLDEFSWPVWNMAVSGNGKVIAVGYISTLFRTTQDYIVRLFRIEDESILPIGEPLYAAQRHDGFGDGLKLNCDGSIVTIGADTKWTLGREPAYVRSFANVDDAWHQIGNDITFNYPGLGDLAISSDGKTIVVGQANDWSDYVHANNFYGQLRTYKLVETDVNK